MRTMSKRKILLVTTRPHPNLLPLTTSLTRSNWIVTLLVKESYSSAQFGDGVEVLVKDPRTISSSWIRDYLVANRPDFLVVRTLDQGFKYFARWARRLGITSLTYNQEPFCASSFGTFQEIFRTAKRILRRYPSIRITPRTCRVEKFGLDSKFAKGFIHPVSTCDDCSETATVNFEPPDDTTLNILCVAKLDQPRKRIDWLLTALTDLDIKVKLTVIGSRLSAQPESLLSFTDRFNLRSGLYRNKLEALSRRFEEKHLLEIVEAETHEHVKNYFHQSDLFVLPSTAEPFAISPLEAMSHGLPVLISDSNGAKSYVKNGTNGLIFKARSRRDFKLKLMKLVRDRELRHTLGSQALYDTQTLHTPQSFGSWFQALAESLDRRLRQAGKH